MRSVLSCFVAAATLTACGTPQTAAKLGSATSAKSVAAKGGQMTSGSAGGLNYKLYVPQADGPRGVLPLVVMLHGCVQDGTEIAAVSGLNTLADRERFVALYPEESYTHHMNRCWRWFDSAHQKRDAGEPATIKAMIDQVRMQHNTDPSRTYVAGLSAGGAMAAVLAAVYPDVFAAASSAAGMEYLAATNEIVAWQAMSLGGPDPLSIAPKIFKLMGDKPATMPMLVFHGTSDITVNRKNGEQTIAQWVGTNNLVLNAIGRPQLPTKPTRTEKGQAPGGRTFTTYAYDETPGKALVEGVVIDGMGHAWPGGASGHMFSDPTGPDASARLWSFFRDRKR
jgi:poly(hydroxyalkanoate) depolymerase family esterase